MALPPWGSGGPFSLSMSIANSSPIFPGSSSPTLNSRFIGIGDPSFASQGPYNSSSTTPQLMAGAFRSLPVGFGQTTAPGPATAQRIPVPVSTVHNHSYNVQTQGPQSQSQSQVQNFGQLMQGTSGAPSSSSMVLGPVGSSGGSHPWASLGPGAPVVSSTTSRDTQADDLARSRKLLADEDRKAKELEKVIRELQAAKGLAPMAPLSDPSSNPSNPPSRSVSMFTNNNKDEEDGRGPSAAPIPNKAPTAATSLPVGVLPLRAISTLTAAAQERERQQKQQQQEQQPTSDKIAAAIAAERVVAAKRAWDPQVARLQALLTQAEELASARGVALEEKEIECQEKSAMLDALTRKNIELEQSLRSSESNALRLTQKLRSVQEQVALEANRTASEDLQLVAMEARYEARIRELLETIQGMKAGEASPSSPAYQNPALRSPTSSPYHEYRNLELANGRSKTGSSDNNNDNDNNSNNNSNNSNNNNNDSKAEGQQREAPETSPVLKEPSLEALQQQPEATKSELQEGRQVVVLGPEGGWEGWERQQMALRNEVELLQNALRESSERCRALEDAISNQPHGGERSPPCSPMEVSRDAKTLEDELEATKAKLFESLERVQQLERAKEAEAPIESPISASADAKLPEGESGGTGGMAAQEQWAQEASPGVCSRNSESRLSEDLEIWQELAKEREDIIKKLKSELEQGQKVLSKKQDELEERTKQRDSWSETAKQLDEALDRLKQSAKEQEEDVKESKNREAKLKEAQHHIESLKTELEEAKTCASTSDTARVEAEERLKSVLDEARLKEEKLAAEQEDNAAKAEELKKRIEELEQQLQEEEEARAREREEMVEETASLCEQQLQDFEARLTEVQKKLQSESKAQLEDLEKQLAAERTKVLALEEERCSAVQRQSSLRSNSPPASRRASRNFQGGIIDEGASVKSLESEMSNHNVNTVRSQLASIRSALAASAEKAKKSMSGTGNENQDSTGNNNNKNDNEEDGGGGSSPSAKKDGTAVAATKDAAAPEALTTTSSRNAEAKTQELELLKEEVARLRSSSEDAQKLVQEAQEREQKEFHKQLSSLRQELELEKQRADELEKQRQASQSQQDSDGTDLKEVNAKMSTRVWDLEQEVKLMQTRLYETEQQREEVQKELTERDGQMSQLREIMISRLRESEAKRQQAEEDFDQEMQEFKQNLEESFAEKEEGLLEQLRIAEQSRRELNEVLHESEKSRQQLHEQLVAKDQELQALKQQQEDLQQQSRELSNLHNQLQAKDREISELIARKDRENLENLDQKDREFQEKSGKLREEWGLEKAALEQRIQSLLEEKQKAESMPKTEDVEVRQLKAAVRDKDERLNEALDEIISLRAERAKLKAALPSATAAAPAATTTTTTTRAAATPATSASSADAGAVAAALKEALPSVITTATTTGSGAADSGSNANAVLPTPSSSAPPTAAAATPAPGAAASSTQTAGTTAAAATPIDAPTPAPTPAAVTQSSEPAGITTTTCRALGQQEEDTDPSPVLPLNNNNNNNNNNKHAMAETSAVLPSALHPVVESKDLAPTSPYVAPAFQQQQQNQQLQQNQQSQQQQQQQQQQQYAPPMVEQESGDFGAETSSEHDADDELVAGFVSGSRSTSMQAFGATAQPQQQQQQQQQQQPQAQWAQQQQQQQHQQSQVQQHQQQLERRPSDSSSYGSDVAPMESQELQPQDEPHNNFEEIDSSGSDQEHEQQSFDAFAQRLWEEKQQRQQQDQQQPQQANLDTNPTQAQGQGVSPTSPSRVQEHQEKQGESSPGVQGFRQAREQAWPAQPAAPTPAPAPMSNQEAHLAWQQQPQQQAFEWQQFRSEQQQAWPQVHEPAQAAPQQSQQQPSWVNSGVFQASPTQPQVGWNSSGDLQQQQQLGQFQSQHPAQQQQQQDQLQHQPSHQQCNSTGTGNSPSAQASHTYQPTLAWNISDGSHYSQHSQTAAPAVTPNSGLQGQQSSQPAQPALAWNVSNNSNFSDQSWSGEAPQPQQQLAPAPSYPEPSPAHQQRQLSPQHGQQQQQPNGQADYHTLAQWPGPTLSGQGQMAKLGSNSSSGSPSVRPALRSPHNASPQGSGHSERSSSGRRSVTFSPQPPIAHVFVPQSPHNSPRFQQGANDQTADDDSSGSSSSDEALHHPAPAQNAWPTAGSTSAGWPESPWTAGPAADAAAGGGADAAAPAWPSVAAPQQAVGAPPPQGAAWPAQGSGNSVWGDFGAWPAPSPTQAPNNSSVSSGPATPWASGGWPS